MKHKRMLIITILSLTLVACGSNAETPKTYNVRWENYDGKLLELDENVSEGSMPSYDSTNPTKPSTAQFSYSFSGWSPELSSVKNDITYTAQYTSTVNSYTITWDVDGYKTTETYNYGETPSYKNGTPTKASTSQYSYTFNGWSPELSPVENNITYTAQYTSSVNTYTIIWNVEGLITTENYNYGEMPYYKKGTPTKPSTSEYSYTFSGWSPEVTTVTGNKTYVATFSSHKITYTINFDLNGGSSPSYTGPKTIESFTKDIFFFDCKKDGWNFRGWSYNGIKIFDEKGTQLNNPTMQSQMTFTAIYAQTAKLTIISNLEGAGVITGEGEYSYNTYVDVFAYPNQGFEFIGWYYENTPLSNSNNYRYMMWNDDVVLEARFKLLNYKINIHTNNPDNGLVLLKSNINFDFKPQYEESREYKSQVSIAAYSKNETRFLGWYDTDNKLVETNAVYSFVMPNYNYTLEAKWNYFNVSYNLNGGVNNPSNPSSYCIEDGLISLYEPTKTGYTFLGWKYDGLFISEINSNWLTDVFLEAIWETEEFKITYVLGEGENNPLNPNKYTIEDECIVLQDAIKEGDLFDGWYLEPSFKTEITSIDCLLQEDITLYGKWCNLENFLYTLSNNKITIVGVRNKSTMMNADFSSMKLNKYSIVSIGSYAFSDCTSLTSITFPKALESIDQYAFEDCNYLQNIVIPKNVISIGHCAFSGCSRLTICCEVSSKPNGWASTWNNSNRPVIWSCINYGTYNNIKYGVSFINNEKTITITGLVDESVVSVNIPSLINVDGENVPITSIGDSAFRNCISLESILIPEHVISIGNHAFQNCTSLKSLIMSDNVECIGKYAFSSCQSLETLVLSKNLISIDEYAFYYCPSLKSIVIPNTVKSIGKYAFFQCVSLDMIFIPNSVTSMGGSVFYDCSSLVIYCEASSKPSGWSSYWASGKQIFWSCVSYGEYNNLLYVVYEVENIKYATIAGVIDENISSINIPSCINIKGENIVVNSISDYVFQRCQNLSSISLPNTINFIGKRAFSECINLSTINIPNSILSIGDYAFCYCPLLESIIIPSSVTSIGDYAFYNCLSLTIYCEATSKPDGWSSFWNDSGRPVVWGYTPVE